MDKTKNETPKQDAGLRAQSEQSASPAEIIPVGQEPRRIASTADSAIPTTGRGDSGQRRNDNKSNGRGIRNPDGLRQYANALREVRIFRQETMRHLRRAEICAWEAIHNCQGKDGARISQKTIATLAGIKMPKHVGKAITALERKGLLEVIFKGRFRANAVGLASIYRVYPLPEPRLASEPLERQKKQRSKTQTVPKLLGAFEKGRPK